jgi:hypothetical protein
MKQAGGWQSGRDAAANGREPRAAAVRVMASRNKPILVFIWISFPVDEG